VGGDRAGDQGDPLGDLRRAGGMPEGELVHLDREPEQRARLGPARRQGGRVTAGVRGIVEPAHRGARIREPQPFARLPVHRGCGRRTDSGRAQLNACGNRIRPGGDQRTGDRVVDPPPLGRRQLTQHRGGHRRDHPLAVRHEQALVAQ
jgi:hypothetical protein